MFQFSAGENTSIKSGAYLIYAQVSETVSLSAPSNSLTSVKVKPRCEFEEVKEKVWQTANDWEVLTTLVLQVNLSRQHYNSIHCHRIAADLHSQQRRKTAVGLYS